MVADEEFDYVVVGAGSAGCVVANRLSEDGRNSVLLLEYGGSDRSLFVRMPAALSMPMNMPRFDWGYVGEPEPGLGGRVLRVPRGKGLGGSSSINGLVYVRGHALDFDRWEDEGARGWAYRDVLPYFRRAETRREGADSYRGGEGPLSTRAGDLRNPLYRAFVEAGRQAGYALSDDLNGFRQEGFGRLDMTVREGIRCSAAVAYLAPARGRANLSVVTGARAEAVSFEGRRAVGIRYSRGATTRIARARRETILCAGAIGSPQLLMLSGIGPARHLRERGVTVVQDLPGVGANLQDHLEFYFQVESKTPITLYSKTGPFGRGLVGLRWLLHRSGDGATNHFEAGGFVRSRAGVRFPDIQFHFLPLAVSYDGKKLADGHGFQAHVGPMRSKSRGRVGLRSPDPRDPPRIFFDYMSHTDDRAEMRACVRLTREIFAQEAFATHRGRELSPGADIVDDDAIDAFVRERAESAYHPSCTCKMGAPDDPSAVLDPQGRVRGVEALRVVDASAMPSITNGNLNAPTIMIGEKLSDAILGKTPLPPSDAPFHVAKDWEARQR